VNGNRRRLGHSRPRRRAATTARVGAGD